LKKVIIDWPSPDGFGLFGFLCFFVALILVILMGFWYDWQLMAICIIIFLCGGFAGRGFEKRYLIKKWNLPPAEIMDAMGKEHEKKTPLQEIKEDH